MDSAISSNVSHQLSRSEPKTEEVANSALVLATVAGLSDEESHDLLWEAPTAEQWRRALRVIAAEVVREISGYDIRRYLIEDAEPATARH